MNKSFHLSASFTVIAALFLSSHAAVVFAQQTETQQTETQQTETQQTETQQTETQLGAT